jgi:hypothetical protein
MLFRSGVAAAVAMLGMGACTTDTTDAETRREGKWVRLIRHEEAAPWGTTSTSALHIDGFPPLPTACAPPRKSEVRFSPDGTRLALHCNDQLWIIVDLPADGGMQSREWARARVNWNDIWAAPAPTEAPAKKL